MDRHLLKNLFLVALIVPFTTACVFWTLGVSETIAEPPPRFSQPAPEVTLSDWHIVYLAPSSTGNINTEPATLAADGVTVVFTWDDFITQTEDGVDAVILHADILDLVDTDVIAGYYRDSIVIAGFDIDGVAMAELVGDDDIMELGIAQDSIPEDESKFVIIARSGDIFGTQSTRTTELLSGDGLAFFKYQLASIIERYSPRR